MLDARRRRLERWLKRDPLISFPATKQQVMLSLRRTGAPERLIRLVRDADIEVYEDANRIVATSDRPPVGTRSRTRPSKSPRPRMPKRF